MLRAWAALVVRLRGLQHLADAGRESACTSGSLSSGASDLTPVALEKALGLPALVGLDGAQEVLLQGVLAVLADALPASWPTELQNSLEASGSSERKI